MSGSRAHSKPSHVSQRFATTRWSIVIRAGRRSSPDSQQALAALQGVAHIIHAGDVGAPEVLEGLGAVAPVTAVRGNNDRGRWAAALPETRVVEIGGATLYVLHDVKTLGLDPHAAGYAAVVSGHSHVPRIEERRGVLYVNPGSAGPRRFRLPVAVARLTVSRGRVRARIVPLENAACAS